MLPRPAIDAALCAYAIVMKARQELLGEYGLISSPLLFRAAVARDSRKERESIYEHFYYQRQFSTLVYARIFRGKHVLILALNGKQAGRQSRPAEAALSFCCPIRVAPGV
ncbi:hypothetical protein Pmani_018053 [Petrolisthes manimaculis]|uniref:Uncharacterized protein n=1 Tax=Petrolisthes manimaculis TaxID=1843537 RepID=A0AAE1PM61_9EUCA|nr:hypothetical protein Pmani_018053 [Petrolisthes manimaculis]